MIDFFTPTMIQLTMGGVLVLLVLNCVFGFLRWWYSRPGNGSVDFKDMYHRVVSLSTLAPAIAALIAALDKQTELLTELTYMVRSQNDDIRELRRKDS